jgi:GNAT superfamily N-acetyltransferase
VGRLPYALRRASPSSLGVILDLVEEAAEWLRGKNTDQWARPWPDARGRDERMLQDLKDGKTWIVWDDNVPAGTITMGTDDPVDVAGRYVWPARKRQESALYLHRAVVRRSHAGLGLGAALFDWASEVAMRQVGKPLLRIDVWTDNWELHAYYRRLGFALSEFRDPRALPGYPSRALFERRVRPGGPGGHSALFTVREPPEPWRTPR